MSLTLENYYNSLPLAGSHWKIPLLGILYIVAIRVGIFYMKNNPPIQFIKKITPLFNILQVIANSFIVYAALSDLQFIKKALGNLYGDKEMPEDYQKKFIFLAYMWCLIKISDFLDTMFFILLKKFSHVSFLHVYHHFTTMIVAFCVFKYLVVEQAMVYAAVNCVVHVVMYSYYFLTSLGYRPKWKKVVTIMQLLQFILLLTTTFYLIIFQKNPKYFYFSIFGIYQCIMFMYLFGKFYVKAYRKKCM